MADGLSLNLQLLQNISDMTGGTAAGAGSANNKPAVYAKEGDPKYNEDMDYDQDGVVTMEEYQQYCEENNINTEEQAAQTVQNKVDSMLDKQASENMDYDGYIKYCEENCTGAVQNSGKVESSGVSDAGLVIRSVGKALSSYSGSGIKLPEAKIERNA